MSVKHDIQKGKEAELHVIDLFGGMGISSFLNTDKKTQKFFDITLDNEMLLEVKYDLYTEKSGNIAIEIWNTRKNEPSGINVTKSHFWIQVMPNPITPFICVTSRLKDFVKEEKPVKTVMNAGDGNASILLYKKDYILDKIFTRLDSFKTREEFLSYASSVDISSAV